MDAMFFETTMRRFLGKPADGIAGGSIALDLAARRPWIRKALRIMRQRVGTLDTTAGHRERMDYEISQIDAALDSGSDPSWPLVDRLLALIASLFGFTTNEGKPNHEAVYFQSLKQLENSQAAAGQHPDRAAMVRNLQSLRRELLTKLKSEGLTYFEIAVVFRADERALAREIRSYADVL